jgi:acetylserotonin N-methyltransferase
VKDQPSPRHANKQPDLPDSSPVIESIEAFRRSKAMFAAVSLGIFDTLERDSADAESLATALQLSREPLER